MAGGGGVVTMRPADQIDHTTLKPWVGVIANASAGRGHGRRRVAQYVEALAKYGFACQVAWTHAERRALIAQAVADPSCRCLVAAGGDGTVATLLNERPARAIPIATLPSGTENLFATEFGLNSCPDEVARAVALGTPQPIDLGEVVEDRRLFSLMAGVGFDADVVTRHHLTRLKGRPEGSVGTTSRLAYVRSILESSWEYRFPTVQARFLEPTSGRDQVLEGAMVFMFNLPRYALGLPVVPPRPAADGKLDLIVFQRPGVPHMVRYLWMVARGVHLNRPDVTHCRVVEATLSIQGERPAPIQLDGDPGGFLEPGHFKTIRVVPSAVSVMVPPRYRWRAPRGPLAFHLGRSGCRRHRVFNDGQSDGLIDRPEAARVPVPPTTIVESRRTPRKPAATSA